MPWGRWFAPSQSDSNNDDDGASRREKGRTWLQQMTGNDKPRASPPSGTKNESQAESVKNAIRDHLSVPHNWIAPAAAAALTLGLLKFYQSYLRRFPGPGHIAPSFFRRRSLFGKVTSVGDGDGFHMFHTPGGRLAGWGWLRRVPKDRKELKGRTVRLPPPATLPPPS